MNDPEINEIKQLIEAGFNDINLDDKRKAIFLVGESGCGRSTLMQLLLGDPTLMITGKDANFLFVDSGTIGTNSFVSKTTKPNICFNATTGQMFVELTGFELRGINSKLELVASALNKIVLNRVKRAKIVLVECFNNITPIGKRGAFQKNLEALALILQHNFRAFENSIGIIATKVKIVNTDEQLTASVLKFLKTLRSHLISVHEQSTDDASKDHIYVQIELLRFIISKKSIGIFRAPNESGIPWTIDSVANSQTALRTLLDSKLKSTVDPILGTFEVFVAPKLKAIMYNVNSTKEKKVIKKFQKIFMILERAVKIRVDSLFKLQPIDSSIGKIIDFCNEVSISFSTVTTFEQFDGVTKKLMLDSDIIDETGKIVSQINFLLDMIGNAPVGLGVDQERYSECLQPFLNYMQSNLNFYVFLSHVSFDLDSYKTRRFNDKIRKDLSENLSVDNCKFQMDLMDDLGFSAYVINGASKFVITKGRVKQIKALVREKTQNPIIKKQTESNMSFEGRFIIASQIKDSIPEEVTEVRLIGQLKVYIDIDLHLENRELLIFSPSIKCLNVANIHVKNVKLMTMEVNNQHFLRTSNTNVEEAVTNVVDLFDSIESEHTLDIFELVSSFSMHVVAEEYSHYSNVETQNFLDKIFSSDLFVKCMNVQRYYEVLKRFGLTTFISGFSLINLQNIYLHILKSVERYKTLLPDENSDKIVCDALKMVCLSRVAFLHTFNDGCQIVNLQKFIADFLIELESIERRLRDGENQMYVQNATEENTVIIEREIAEALILINSKKSSLARTKNELEVEWEKLVTNVKVMKEKENLSLGELEDMQKNLSWSMKMKLIVGFIGTVSQLVGIFCPPVAKVGQVFSQLFADDSTSNHDYQSVWLQNIISDAKSFLRQSSSKRGELQILLRNLVQNNTDDIFTSDERKILSDIILKFDKPGEILAFLSDTDQHFDKLETILKEKIGQMQSSAKTNHGVLYSTLVAAYGCMDHARLVGSAAKEFAKTYNEHEKDAFMMKQIDIAIKENRKVIATLETYDNYLHQNFGPMLAKMVETFENWAIGLSGESSVFLVTQKFQVTKYANECLTLIKRLTLGFDEDCDRLCKVMSDLQIILAELVNVYDKVYELECKKRLFNFLGNFHHDRFAIAAYSEAYAEVEINKLTIGYLHVHKANMQVHFPFGEESLERFQSVVAKLQNENINAINKVCLLIHELSNIKTSLAQNSINNNRDEFTYNAHFQSNYLSSQPFYVWKNIEYSKEIRKLLQEEPVEFLASIFAKDVRNAVKFNTIELNFTAQNETVREEINNLLKHFTVSMTHSGENYYKFGNRLFVISGTRLNITHSFERDACGAYVSRNNTHRKISCGDILLSPYTVWTFKLNYVAITDSTILSQKEEVLSSLAKLAANVDLELVGIGEFVEESTCTSLKIETEKYYKCIELNALPY